MNEMFLYSWQTKKYTFHFSLGKKQDLLPIEFQLDVSFWQLTSIQYKYSLKSFPYFLNIYHNDKCTHEYYQKVGKPLQRLPFHYRPLQMVSTHTKQEILGVVAPTKYTGELEVGKDDPSNLRRNQPTKNHLQHLLTY